MSKWVRCQRAHIKRNLLYMGNNTIIYYIVMHLYTTIVRFAERIAMVALL